MTVKPRAPEKTEDTPPRDERKVCGIVMPISQMGDDYPESHWIKVRKVVQRAIERAGLRPQLVWENSNSDVIQSAILQNIYENDVVVCDLSGLNPNVMLETGLRLSTKRPTIMITDGLQKPPFDIGIINYYPYPKDLEFNLTDKFINDLSDKIKEASELGPKYKSFVEHFRFETVSPGTITLTFEDFIRERLDQLGASIQRLERRANPSQTSNIRRLKRPEAIGTLVCNTPETVAEIIEERIDDIPEAYCVMRNTGGDRFEFTIHLMTGSNADPGHVLFEAKKIIERAQTDHRSL